MMNSLNYIIDESGDEEKQYVVMNIDSWSNCLWDNRKGIRSTCIPILSSFGVIRWILQFTCHGCRHWRAIGTAKDLICCLHFQCVWYSMLFFVMHTQILTVVLNIRRQFQWIIKVYQYQKPTQNHTF